MRMRLSPLLIALAVVLGVADQSEARWRLRHRRCYYPAFVTCAPQPTQAPQRLRIQGIAEEEGENVPRRATADVVTPFNVTIPAEDIFNGTDRKTPKTTVVHDGENQIFQDVDELIGFFESPERKQEQWWGTVIKKTTEERNAQIELVNVTVQDAWIYEISKQADNDYHLLIGVSLGNDAGRYLNAEISAINAESPDTKELWELRKSFKQQFEDHEGSLPALNNFIQPATPIHIRLSGSIFLDADHGRRKVGHGNIKNFTSWEIHPITSIQILDN